MYDWNFDCHTDHEVHLQVEDIVDGFIRKKFLYWLEALSLYRSMPKGVLGISLDRLPVLVMRSAYFYIVNSLDKSSNFFSQQARQHQHNDHTQVLCNCTMGCITARI
jgi:hypothetical protein